MPVLMKLSSYTIHTLSKLAPIIIRHGGFGFGKQIMDRLLRLVYDTEN